MNSMWMNRQRQAHRHRNNRNRSSRPASVPAAYASTVGAIDSVNNSHPPSYTVSNNTDNSAVPIVYAQAVVIDGNDSYTSSSSEVVVGGDAQVVGNTASAPPLDSGYSSGFSPGNNYHMDSSTYAANSGNSTAGSHSYTPSSNNMASVTPSYTSSPQIDNGAYTTYNNNRRNFQVPHLSGERTTQLSMVNRENQRMTPYVDTNANPTFVPRTDPYV